ncbi:unnamed protein product [Ostreobium quekettii]|uniref:Metallopeptidase n=1 Tax=Ostreobium quekettii TaxID=121088 RepID=A0A8S1J5I8_9CHLO|nr:unnamed protein product [Ostreobium quekettii]|eukprot:evm.model.scf_2165EXC.3 EVM.evm.TU.scf_2165EXC.3   scf_2165EXC:14768-15652(+)
MRTRHIGTCLFVMAGILAMGEGQDAAEVAGIGRTLSASKWRTGAEEDEVRTFLLGNTLFTLYHELAHALVSDLYLPVVGKEEDAADGFAAVMMIPRDGQPLQANLIKAAARGWSLAGREDAEDGEDLAFWGLHSLDEQRHFALVCYLAGSDPKRFNRYALDSGMPKSRVKMCRGDYLMMLDGWMRLLDTHFLEKPSNVSGSISVAYAEPRGEVEAAVRDLVKASGLMEYAAVAVEHMVDLPRDIEIDFKHCTMPWNAAYWDPFKARVVICYHFIEEFRGLIREDMVERSLPQLE